MRLQHSTQSTLQEDLHEETLRPEPCRNPCLLSSGQSAKPCMQGPSAAGIGLRGALLMLPALRQQTPALRAHRHQSTKWACLAARAMLEQAASMYAIAHMCASPKVQCIHVMYTHIVATEGLAADSTTLQVRPTQRFSVRLCCPKYRISAAMTVQTGSLCTSSDLLLSNSAGKSPAQKG